LRVKAHGALFSLWQLYLSEQDSTL
jgi:hypothetical protein